MGPREARIEAGRAASSDAARRPVDRGDLDVRLGGAGAHDPLAFRRARCRCSDGRVLAASDLSTGIGVVAGELRAQARIAIRKFRTGAVRFVEPASGVCVPGDLEFGDNSPYNHNIEVFMILLDQGQGQVVAFGTEVWNTGVTSCGLVLAFGKDNVAAYHWPFMSDEHQYYQAFQELVDGIGETVKIEIYTNPVPSGSKSIYDATTRTIHKKYSVHTIHYIYGNSLRGDDVRVTLDQQGTQVFPLVSSTFLDLQ